MKFHQLSIIILLWYACSSCNKGNGEAKTTINEAFEEKIEVVEKSPDSTYKSIHVFVALCDNKYQNIAPVPASIGNGQDPNNNMYWGGGYGVRSYFGRSKSWKKISVTALNDSILERAIFKHTSKNWIIVADAYDGRYIEQCTTDFLKALGGMKKSTIPFEGKELGIEGHSKMACYIGHDVLMDFGLDEKVHNADNKSRDCIILACFSQRYFTDYVKELKGNPLLWTTNLMGPEAYTLHEALDAYVKNEPTDSLRSKAARIYSKYAKCSYKAARGLLVSGFPKQ